MHAKHGIWLSLAAVLVLTVPLACPASSGEFTQRITLSGDPLVLVNLIGEIRLEGHDGPQFEVEITVRGKDATDDLIEVETEEGDEARLIVRFPLDDECHYVYPPLGRNSNTSFSPPGTNGRANWLSWLGLGGCRQIKVKGRGSGLEVWADVVVKVPAGKKLKVVHGVGAILAEAIEADLDLDISSGPITAQGMNGNLRADTGSGSVKVRDLRGDVDIDTGSGSVRARNCSGQNFLVDTGSGSVEVEDITCRRLVVDTGSGGVRARDIAADEATIDTGSGSVKLALVEMGPGYFEVDTGSGSIELILPKNASAKILADTGSGSVSVDTDGGRMKKVRSDHVSMIIGDGEARVRLDTCSGSIRIRQSG